MKKVTSYMALDWKAMLRTMSVREIAAMYGVHKDTVYLHTKSPKKRAERQAQWRAGTAKRKATLAERNA